jgi:ribosomal protein S27E
MPSKKFEIPDMELYCEKCETTNYIYSDMKPPYKCNECGSVLEFDENEAQ